MGDPLHHGDDLDQILVTLGLGPGQILPPEISPGQLVQSLVGPVQALFIEPPPVRGGRIVGSGKSFRPVKESVKGSFDQVPVAGEVAQLFQHTGQGLAEAVVIEIGGIGLGDAAKIGQPLGPGPVLAGQDIGAWLVGVSLAGQGAVRAGLMAGVQGVQLAVKQGEDLIHGLIF